MTARDVEELREATREAHAALKDIKQASRELASERQRLAELVASLTSTRVEQLVGATLDGMQGELVKRAHDLYDTLSKEATLMMNVALYGNRQGRGDSVFDQVRKLREDVERALLDHSLRSKR